MFLKVRAKGGAGRAGAGGSWLGAITADNPDGGAEGASKQFVGVALVLEELGDGGAEGGIGLGDEGGVGLEGFVEAVVQGTDLGGGWDVDFDDVVPPLLDEGVAVLPRGDGGHVEPAGAGGVGVVAVDVVDGVEAAGADEVAEHGACLVDRIEAHHERGVEVARAGLGVGVDVGQHEIDAFGDALPGRGVRGFGEEGLEGIDGGDVALVGAGEADGEGALAASEIEDAGTGFESGACEEVCGADWGAAEVWNALEEIGEDGDE